MGRINVVVPAPFAPTRPYTPPRGISRLTEESAARVPKRRVRSETAITGSAAAIRVGETQMVQRDDGDYGFTRNVSGIGRSGAAVGISRVKWRVVPSNAHEPSLQREAV